MAVFGFVGAEVEAGCNTLLWKGKLGKYREVEAWRAALEEATRAAGRARWGSRGWERWVADVGRVGSKLEDILTAGVNNE